MAKEKSAKVTFLADTKDFRKNVTEANSTLTEIRSELKLNEEQMKTNGTSTEALAERHKLLEAQLEQARSKTQNLAAQMESCTENFGENSSEAQKLATQINNAKIAEEKIRQEINKTVDALSKQSEESAQTETALESLEKTISDQEAGMKDLQRTYADAVLTYGETSYGAIEVAREIEKLSGELNDNRNKMAKAQKAASDFVGSLDKIDDEAEESKNALEKLEDTISDQEKALADLKSEYAAAALEYGTNSREAKDLAKEIKSLSGELNESRSKMSLVERAADNMAGDVRDAGDAAEDANEGFTVWKATLADLASSGIQSVLSGISGLASSFWNLGDETRELRTNLGKVEVAFGNSGLSAEQASETYEDFYAIVADEGQATEAVSHLAKIADSQQNLTEWTSIATGVYATFGDSLPLESLTEAANETIKVGKVTGSLADALNWSTMSSEEWQTAFEGHPKALKKFESAIKQGLPVEDAFNEALTKCTTESEREQVIRQALTGLYGEAAAAYAETNGAIMEANEAQANYNNALAGLGEIIEPIKTTFMNGMAGMLESVTAFISGLDVEGIKTMISDAFSYINDTVFPAIQTGIQWFIDNKDIVIAGLAGIVAGIAAFQIVSIIQTAVGAFKAFQAATEGLTLAQKLLNLVMNANPIGIIIGLIAALVAGFIYLWNNCDAFREFWIGLWDNIQSAFSAVVDWIVNAFNVVVNFFAENWQSVLLFILNPIAGAISYLWENCEWFRTFITETWNSIKEAVVTAVTSMWTSVTEWFSSLWSSITTTVSNIWTSVTTWFTNTKNNVVATVTELWSSVTSWFSNLWTSLVNIVSNIWRNITTIWDNIKNTISTTAQNIWSTITSIFNSIRDSIASVWNTIKQVISTVWETIKSNVSNAINNVRVTIAGVFNSVKATVANIWDNIKSKISSVWDGIKTGVKSAVDNVRTTVAGVFNGIKNTVETIWESIKSTITDKIESAKETVSGVLDTIKGLFDFEFQWPKLPMPHFSISGSINPLDWFTQGVPTLSVEWYAKGGILEKPTLFGMGADGRLLGGGEAGAEAVAPIDVLLGYVRTAVADVFQTMSNAASVDSALSHIESLENHLDTNDGGDLSRLIDAIEDLASRPINLDIDSVRVATATAGASDTISGNRLNLKSRGLALP